MELPRAVQKKKKFFSHEKKPFPQRKASSLGIMSKNKLSLLYPK